MAKTFVQLIAAAAILGVIIVIISMPTILTEEILGLFVFSLPIIGGTMLYRTIKSRNILQNAEYGLIGLTSIILGITYWFPDTQLEGYSIKGLGLMLAIGVLLFLIIKIVLEWKMGGGSRL